MTAGVKQEQVPSRRIVRGVVIQFETPAQDIHGHRSTRIVTAERGETVMLTRSEEVRLDELGMLYPEGSSIEEAEAATEAHLDNYRAGRGDQEAYARVLQRARQSQPRPVTSGLDTMIDDSGVSQTTVQTLAEWIRAAHPTVDEVVGRAEGYPENAERLLEAENLATDGSPRKGVVGGLQSIIDGAAVNA